MDMALVQAAFIGSVVVFPSHFGAGGATTLDLEGYLHLWRVVGYYLGVKDSCNLAKLPCLEESRKLFLEVGEELIVPSMLNYSPESLHMAKVTCGKFFDFHLSLYCHCYGKQYLFAQSFFNSQRIRSHVYFIQDFCCSSWIRAENAVAALYLETEVELLLAEFHLRISSQNTTHQTLR